MSTRPLLPSLLKRIPPLPFSQCLLIRLSSTSSATNGGLRRSPFNGKERQDFGHGEEGSTHRGGRAFPPSQGWDFGPSNDRPYDRSYDRPYDRSYDRSYDRPRDRTPPNQSYWESGEFPRTPRANFPFNRTSGNQTQGRSREPRMPSYSSPTDSSFNRNPRSQTQGDRDSRGSHTPSNSSYPSPADSFDHTRNKIQGDRGFRESRPPFNSSYSSPTDSFGRNPRSQTQGDRDFKESHPPFNSSYSSPTDSFGRNPRSQTQGDRDFKESRPPFNSSYSSPTDSFDRNPHSQTQGDRDFKEPRPPFNSSYSSPTGSFDRNSRNQTQRDRDFKEPRPLFNSSYSSPTNPFDRTPPNQTQRDRESRESPPPPNFPNSLRTNPYPSRLRPTETPYPESRPPPRLDPPPPSSNTTTSCGIWNPPGSTRPTPPTVRTWSPSPGAYTDAFPGSRNWHPPPKPNPRLDYAPQEVEWTPKPRRYIPKLNPDAEWIYGTSVVEAALKAGRREMLRLYIYDGKQRTAEVRERDKAMEKLARAVGIEVIEEKDLGTLDSMSDSRIHNGYILECLPLPKTPILSLGAVSPTKSSFSITLAQHTPTNEEIPTDKYPTTIYNRDPKKRYPFVLMLDEILDPGNLGAILRSAYFLGVTAITLSSRNCAPLSPVCLKAAVGAAEFIPILEQSRSDKLITSSIENGWTFYAAVPPVTKHQMKRNRYVLASDVGEKLEQGPVCLILGSEGEGLRLSLKKCAQYCVSLEKAPGTDRVVDSLNVSVAAALLSNSFLKVA